MEVLIGKVTEYLNKESILVKDEIIIGVIIGIISTLAVMVILWIFKGIIIKLLKTISIKLLKPIIKKIGVWYKRYIKQRFTIKELLHMQTRLDNGEKLKWYEKREYSRQVGDIKNFGISRLKMDKEMQEMISNIDLSDIINQPIQRQMPEIKPQVFEQLQRK